MLVNARVTAFTVSELLRENQQPPIQIKVKKIVHVLFCVFQTNLNKAVNIYYTLSEWIRNVQMIQCFSIVKT